MKLLLILISVLLTQASISAAYECSGAFVHKGGGIVTVSPFDLGDGQRHFLFVDFRTGYIRILKEEANEFTAGATLFSDSPIELRIQCAGKELHWKINDASDEAVRISVTEEKVRFSNGTIHLAGTLYIPQTKSYASVVLLHGSGSLNRYSFGPMAYFFAASGITVLAYDKRGTGESSGNLDEATLNELAEDGAAAVQYLRGRKEVDPKSIGLWGSSQGGFLAASVASRTNPLRFIVNQSGMYVPVWQQEIYRTKAEMTSQGFSAKEISTALDYLNLFFEVAKTGNDWPKLQQRMQELKDQKWFDVVPHIDNLKNLQWYWNTLYSFDPVKPLQNVSCPVLGVFGGLDRSTPVPETVENIKRGLTKAQFEYRIFPTANHGLLEAKTGSEREIPALTHLIPEAFEYQLSWIMKVLTSN